MDNAVEEQAGGPPSTTHMTLSALPNPVLLEIMARLTDVYDICALARTCPALWAVATSSALWPRSAPPGHQGPLEAALRNLLASILHLPPQIFSLHIEPTRSRSFPISVGCNNLLAILGSPDASALAEQLSEGVRAVLKGLPSVKRAVQPHEMALPLPPAYSAFGVCRAERGSIRLGLHPPVAVPLLVAHALGLPPSPRVPGDGSAHSSAVSGAEAVALITHRAGFALRALGPGRVWHRAPLEPPPQPSPPGPDAVQGDLAMQVWCASVAPAVARLVTQALRKPALQARGCCLLPQDTPGREHLFERLTHATARLMYACRLGPDRPWPDAPAATSAIRAGTCAELVVGAAALEALLQLVYARWPGPTAQATSPTRASLACLAPALSAAATEEDALLCCTVLEPFPANLLAALGARGRETGGATVLSRVAGGPELEPATLSLHQLVFRTDMRGTSREARGGGTMAAAYAASATPPSGPWQGDAAELVALCIAQAAKALTAVFEQCLEPPGQRAAVMLWNMTPSADGACLALAAQLAAAAAAVTQPVGGEPCNPQPTREVVRWAVLQGALRCLGWYLWMLGMDELSPWVGHVAASVGIERAVRPLNPTAQQAVA